MPAAIPHLKGGPDALHAMHAQGEIGEVEFFAQLMLSAVHELADTYGRSKVSTPDPMLSLQTVNEQHPGVLDPETLAVPQGLNPKAASDLIDGINPILRVFEAHTAKFKALIKQTEELDLPPGLQTGIKTAVQGTLARRAMHTACDETAAVKTSLFTNRDHRGLGMPTTVTEMQKKLDDHISGVLVGRGSDDGYRDFVSFLPWTGDTINTSLAEVFPKTQIARATRFVLAISQMGMDTATPPARLAEARGPILQRLGESNLDGVQSLIEQLPSATGTRKYLSSDVIAGLAATQ